MPDAFTPPDSTSAGTANAYRDLTIANGASLSDAVDLGRLSPVGILIPATWTAAVLTFQGSPDGVTYGKMCDTAGEVQIASVAGGEYVVLNPLAFGGVRFLKVRSGTAAAAVAQGGARTLRLVGRVMP